MNLFTGIFEWNEQLPPKYALSGYTSNRTYKRFKIIDILNGNFKIWVDKNKLKVVGFRIQDCVKDKISLPSNHTIAGETSTNLNCFIPNYNDQSYLDYLESVIVKVKDTIKYSLVGRIDLGFGNYGELHIYGLEKSLEYLKPTKESMQNIINLYVKHFGHDILFSGVQNEIFLDLAEKSKITKLFCDSLGLKTDQGENHLEKLFNNANRARIMNTYDVVLELGSSDFSRINMDYAIESVIKHTTFKGFGNGNTRFDLLDSISIDKMKKVYSIFESRKEPDNFNNGMIQISIAEYNKMLDAVNNQTQLNKQISDLESLNDALNIANSGLKASNTALELKYTQLLMVYDTLNTECSTYKTAVQSVQNVVKDL